MGQAEGGNAGVPGEAWWLGHRQSKLGHFLFFPVEGLDSSLGRMRLGLQRAGPTGNRD